MLSLVEIRAALGGTIAGRQVLAPGPGHSARDRSLAVRPSPTAPLGFVVTSHANDDWRECRDYVASRLGIDTSRRPRELSPIERMQAKAMRAEAEKVEAARRERRKAWALAIWVEAADPRGTIVQAYLASRGLDLPAEIASAVLRFHPACPWRDENDALVRIPAMIGLMRNVLTNEPVAIHRTRLTEDGRKVDRKMLAPSEGSAVKLDADAVVKPALVVGEGIESAMSARQLGLGPSWAMGSAGAMERLPVLDGVEALTLLEELDENGRSARAVAQCATRWHRASRAVDIALPEVGNDMNDGLRVGRQ